MSHVALTLVFPILWILLLLFPFRTSTENTKLRKKVQKPLKVVSLGNHICPVCGYSGLDDPPYNERGVGSDEICPCCGFQFGYDDYPDGPLAFTKWRHNWINGGYRWFSKCILPPDGWDPKEQLRAVIHGEDKA